MPKKKRGSEGKTLQSLNIRPYHLILGAFVVAGILYLNIDKVPLTHPGNIKSADAFYHVMAVESIIDTHQWNYYDYYIALGNEKVLSVQPPLYYLNSAILSTFSEAPPWVSLYFLVTISQAFLTIVVYLIAKEVFENKNIALMAGFLSVLPVPVNVWLYGLYIGLWIQVVSFFFILSFMWLFIRFFKTDETWPLLFISLCTLAVMLVHPQDLIILAIPYFTVAGRLFYTYLNNKNLKEFIVRASIISVIPLILFITLLPRFLYVWGAGSSANYLPGFYGVNELYFTRNYLGGLVTPDLFFIPWPLLVLLLFGIIQLIINYRRYSLWLISIVYYLFITYISPFVLIDPHYFMRTRALTPFLFFPIIAYSIYYLIIRNIKVKKSYQYLLSVLIGCLFIAYSFSNYNQQVKQMSGEHIPYNEWKALEWIHTNTQKTDTVLFLGGTFQSEEIYAKRISAAISIDEVQKILNQYLATNSTPTTINGGWTGNTLRHSYKIEDSFWNIGSYEEPSGVLNLLDFDYIFFSGINQQFVAFNNLIAKDLIENKNFRLVYNDAGYMILKNEN